MVENFGSLKEGGHTPDLTCTDLGSCKEILEMLEKAKTPHDFGWIVYEINLLEELNNKNKTQGELNNKNKTKEELKKLFLGFEWYKNNFKIKDDDILSEDFRKGFISVIMSYIRQRDFELYLLKMETKRNSYLKYLEENDFSPEVKTVLAMLIEEYIIGKNFSGYTMTAEQFDKYADEFMENFKRATMLIMDIESNGINQVNLNNSGAYGYFQIKNNNGTGPDGWQNSTIHTTLKLIKELYNKKNIGTPDWILKINKNTDIIKLESDEQTILFMFYIFTRANYTKGEVTENIFDVLIGNWGTIRKGAMRNLYGNHHHTNMKNHPPTEKLFVKKSKFHIPSFEFYKGQFEIKK